MTAHLKEITMVVVVSENISKKTDVEAINKQIGEVEKAIATASDLCDPAKQMTADGKAKL